jgi:hypothetical protein
MEKHTYNHSIRIPVLFGVLSLFYALQAYGLETKRFDAPPPERAPYLSFAKPTPLSFSISPLPVDRLKLVLPPKLIVIKTSSTQATADANATSSSPEPMLGKTTPDGNASTDPQVSPRIPSPFFPQVAPQDSLPLSDPFENINSFNVDSTDELLRILETSDGNNNGSSLMPTPFVPPFTVAADGMRISSKATYRRVKR